MSPYKNIVGYIPNAVYFIFTTHLFWKWESTPLNPAHLIHSSPYCPSLQQQLLSVSITLFFPCLLIWIIFYIPHISEIIWCLSFSVWLTSLSLIPYRSIHVPNDKISFIFYGWVVFLFIYLSMYNLTCSLSIHLLTGS